MLSRFLRKTPRTGTFLGQEGWSLCQEGNWAKTGDIVEKRWAEAGWRWSSVLSPEKVAFILLLLRYTCRIAIHSLDSFSKVESNHHFDWLFSELFTTQIFYYNHNLCSILHEQGEGDAEVLFFPLLIYKEEI